MFVNSKSVIVVFSLAAAAASVSQVATAQNYRLERIASGLNQPTYVTQAPDDPGNILYFTERTDDANPGFGATNNMGRIWRYDVNTRTRTMVYDFDRFVTQDTGLFGVAFHPDFNTQGADGFGKMYVTTAEASGTAINRVEEFDVDIGGPNPTYEASPNRLLLEYQNNAQNNHTVNWIGFDPTATGDERDYLYISTGDGSFGNDYNDGESPNGRPSQNPNDIAGKMLRVDVVGDDAYPDDPDKNFAIPDTNPIPTFNAANPGDPISGLDEVWLTGLRNVYRASFDQQTGDLWMGDVGEVTWEEVNFLKAGANADGPPVDFGWPHREGTEPSDISGASGTTENPFTGVTALEPVQQFIHDGGGEAVIGGYLYRGPVEELQGKYFYSDFVTTGDAAQLWMLDFDRDTDPGEFDGDNGTNTDISALWQSLVVDRDIRGYGPDSTTGSSAGLDHIVSFGTDNAGNLYLVDFGNGMGFDGQYPGAGAGEIFRVTPLADITVTVDRDTGEMTFTNNADDEVNLHGYRLTSDTGGIDPAALTAIAGRLDDSATGDGSVDPNNVWQITSSADDPAEFAEQSTGTAATLAAGQSFTLSPADLDDGESAWVRSIYEDFQLEVMLDDDLAMPAKVEFVGNDGEPFARSDLNFNGQIDADDWALFKANHSGEFDELSIAAAYRLGDLDGDGDNDFDDFRLFQADYDAVFGPGALAALTSVPEPGSLALLGVAVGALFLRRRTAGGRLWAVAAVCSCLAAPASADLVHQYTFNDGTAADSVGNAHGTLEGAATIDLGIVQLPGNDGSFVDLPAGQIDIDDFTDATFEAWFTFEGGGPWQRVFDFGRTNFLGQGRDYIFYTPNSGPGDHRVAITDGGGGGDEDVAVGGPTLDTGQPYHVAVVVDSSGSDQLQLYLDGQLAGSTNLTVNMNDLANDNAYLGRSNWDTDDLLNGTIDEFRIHNNALSSDDVLASFQAGPVPLSTLELEVNTVTGSVAMVNPSAQAISVDYYRIRSAAGALDPTGWNSLDDQELDTLGTAEGQSWDELGPLDSHEVIEAFLLGASTLDAGERVELANLFDSQVFGQGSEGDLVFDFARQGSDLSAGDVHYVTPELMAGDYNDDGVVDAADYSVWRDSLGSTTQLDADGDGDGQVDRDDYTIWAWSFGNNAAPLEASSTAAVPEPHACALLAAGVLLGSVAGRYRYASVS